MGAREWLSKAWEYVRTAGEDAAPHVQAAGQKVTQTAKVVSREMGQFALDEARDGTSALLTDMFGGTQPRSAHERTAQQRAQARAQQQQQEAQQRQAEAIQALQAQVDAQRQEWEQAMQRQQQPGGGAQRRQERDRGYDRDY